MSDDILENSLIGFWKSDVRETEWGQMTLKITFTKDNHFVVESLFDGKNKPMITEGSYKIDRSKIIPDEAWNKGVPFKYSFVGKELLLEVGNDEPIMLHRIQ